jgi:hypothetical protein
MKTTLAQLIKSLWGVMKVAAKDRVDLIMFLILAVLSVLDICGVYLMGAVGFATFYMFWLLIRLAVLKQEMKKAGLIK